VAFGQQGVTPGEDWVVNMVRRQLLHLKLSVAMGSKKKGSKSNGETKNEKKKEKKRETMMKREKMKESTREKDIKRNVNVEGNKVSKKDKLERKK
jgi:hypothetical protein